MERHRKQIATAFVFASALIMAVMPPLSQAQSQAQPTGIDPNLLAKASSGHADAQLAVGKL